MSFRKSLVFKLALPVPVVILICLVIAWAVIPNIVVNNALDAATQAGLQTANQFKTIRGYYTQNVIRKAKATGGLKPAIDHADQPDAIPLPATLIHDLSALLAAENTTMALYSAYPFPNRQDRVMDDFMTSAWAFLNENPDQVFKRQEVRDGSTVMRIAIADKMAVQGCVDCHNAHPQTPKSDWHVGDVRGVLEINSNVDQAMTAAANLKDNILIGIFVAGLAILAVVIAGARAISGPINKMTGAMGDIANGRLDTDVPCLERQDELGQMANALEVFKENTERNVELEAEKAEQRQRKETADAEQKRQDEAVAAERERVADSFSQAMTAISRKDFSYRIAEEFPPDYQKLKDDFNETFTLLSEIIDRISDASAQILSSSGEITVAADNLAGRTEQQAATVEETAAALEEITSAMKSSSERASEASGLVATAKDNAENSGTVVRKAIDAMNKIEASAAEITNIIDVIDDISFQTNLLALNAGVEAARAGEAGQGFAVVASEVRELAQRSTAAAGQIKTLIETSGENVRAGAALVNETGEALETIVADVGQINEHVSAISGTTGEQSVALQEIDNSVNNIDQGTQQTAAIAEEASAASQTLKQEVAGIDAMLREFKTGVADNEIPRNDNDGRPPLAVGG
ncbi:methyl-accepting chemotaxis protein [Nitratireductor sp. XY-223]|uniref:methyl-accepting chemotaxis protein n=1 Tax=Nitratireductor sp. XY-223 TaxID=2561926 RepID=UPI00145BA543|nr:methyl-accepting chemotaxis protein [Nitratireductor sp. XY-223]